MNASPVPSSFPADHSGMFVPQQTAGTVLCCICGVPMSPNPANMCVSCLRSRVDITDGLPRHASVVYCPECRSYLQPPRSWLKAEPESKELLAFLLRRLKPSLRPVRLVHAELVWTEPHSKRLRLRLRVQREALHGALLEQPHIVEFTVHDRLCDNCSRAQANPDQWVAAVQLRQHVPHRRTFFYLEQLVLRHGAAARALRIVEACRGLDFFFGSRSHAQRFVEFVSDVAPVLPRSDKQLVSHDTKSNSYNYKYTFSVELCPICREDLVCLPPKVANALGNLGPLVLCTKVTSSVALLDPATLRCAFLNASQYWRAPFRALLTSRQLVEYIVLDVEAESSAEVSVGGSKYLPALAQVARVSDFGKNDNMFTVRTHLGHLLRPGDYAFGYDLYGANIDDLETDKYKGLVLPDAVLVKKSYEEKRRKNAGKARPWKLKSLNIESGNSAGGRGDEEERKNAEYEQFLQMLEENNDMIEDGISLYRDNKCRPSSAAGDDDELPSVPLEQLIDELNLNDDGDEEDEQNDYMSE